MLLKPTSERSLAHGMLDVLIRAGLIAVLAIICYQVFHPFLNLMLWALILAVTLYPLQRKLAKRMNDREGRSSTLLVIAAIAILLVPVYLLSTSVAQSVETALTQIRSGGVQIPPPNAKVAEWPLVGKPAYELWNQAATDMKGLTQEYAPQIKGFALAVIGKVAGVGVGLLLFVVALALAGVFMAYGKAGHRSAIQIASRIFSPDKGEHVAELCTKTIRAVAQGVIGIAFIQMLLIGVGFVVMGVPGAGLLALLVLLLGIMQIPATIVTVPVIALVLSSQGVSAGTIIFSIYVFVAGLADNVLKPLLLGRGVDVPMPVVLIGALGGMVTGGIIGLFIGPVILAIGYELFWEWVENQPPALESTAPPPPDLRSVPA